MPFISLITGALYGLLTLEKNTSGPSQLNVAPESLIAFRNSVSVVPVHTGLLLVAAIIGVGVMLTVVTADDEQIPSIAVTV